jgi:hypothetical protein
MELFSDDIGNSVLVALKELERGINKLNSLENEEGM